MSDMVIRRLMEEETDYQLELRAACKGEDCGTLKAFVQDEILVVVWFDVEKTYRGCGVGAALLKQAQEMAECEDLNRLVLLHTCHPDDAFSYCEWVQKLGFREPQLGASFLTYRIDTLKQSRILQGELRTGLISEQLCTLRELSVNEIPDEIWDMVQDSGERIDELSLAYLSEGKVHAALFVTLREEGIYLENIYLAGEGDRKPLLYLVRIMLERIIETYSAYEVLLIADFGDTRTESVKDLLEGAQMDMLDEYMTYKPIGVQENGLLLGAGAALVRFHTIVDALNERNVPSRLVLPENGYPYLELKVKNTDRTALFHYIEKDMDEGEGFWLRAYTYADDKPEEIFMTESFDEPLELDEEHVLTDFILPYLERAAADIGNIQ